MYFLVPSFKDTKLSNLFPTKYETLLLYQYTDYEDKYAKCPTHISLYLKNWDNLIIYYKNQLDLLTLNHLYL